MQYGTYLTKDIITHNTCFLPGTQINLANGSYKNIEDIQIGEIVKVFNEETQEYEYHSIEFGVEVDYYLPEFLDDELLLEAINDILDNGITE